MQIKNARQNSSELCNPYEKNFQKILTNLLQKKSIFYRDPRLRNSVEDEDGGGPPLERMDAQTLQRVLPQIDITRSALR